MPLERIDLNSESRKHFCGLSSFSVNDNFKSQFLCDLCNHLHAILLNLYEPTSGQVICECKGQHISQLLTAGTVFQKGN